MGIAGGGLSSLAGLLASRGHRVSGSDRKEAPSSLCRLGVRLHRGHGAEQVGGAELLIRSAAIPEDNVEVLAARRAGVPVLKYSEALGLLLATRRGLAVAGTHGKTSTAAMAAQLLSAAGAAPAWIIGGRPVALASFSWGTGGPFVVEACEFDCSFLNLTYEVALITGISVDHLDCFGDWDGIRRAFGRFCAGVSPGGRLVLGPGVAKALGAELPAGLPVVQVDEVLPLRSARATPDGWQATLGSSADVSLELALLGRHDLDNLRCALVAAHCCGVPLADLLPGVSSLAGVGRRLEDLGEVSLPAGGSVRIIDDFAHHPEALAAALLAARAHWPGRRVLGVFQPHQVCRTEDLLDGFAEVLRGFDQLALCDIFVARDRHPERADAVCGQLARAVGPQLVRAGPAPAAAPRVLDLLRPGDVCLVMGAGDIDGLARRLVGAAPCS